MKPSYRAEDLVIEKLGQATVPSPLETVFTPDDEAVSALRLRSELASLPQGELPAFEAAGPRQLLYFRPETTSCAIVTCGGLCPGLNDVIRGITQLLWRGYGVRRILGIRYGYSGLVEREQHPPLELDFESVSEIHRRGGTILKSSRRRYEARELADGLRALKIDVLFAVGGEGTMAGARAIVSAAREIGWNVAVIGVPKTIDNDIPGIERSFGFETAVQESVRAITSGHIEAHDFPWGVAVIRLMGRDSGFIAAAATVASGDVNFCLVPEVDFDLDGEGGLFDLLERRLRHRGHAVIVVAEGAGKRLLPPEGDRDIGLFLRDAVRQGLRARGIEPSMKYIDPSYMIRSVPANADDSVFCQELAAGAVHAAMSGRTSMMVGYAGGFIVHLPLHKPAEPRRLLDPEGPLWRAVLESTGQPKRIGRARHDV